MKKKILDLQDAVLSIDKGLKIKVFVLPRSSQNKVVGIHDGYLKIKLTKPPVEGQANAECCKVVAKFLGVSKTQVKVVHGNTSRHKVVLVEGISI